MLTHPVFAGAEEGIDQERVVGGGGMIRQQVFQGPAFRQNGRVPDFQAVFIDTDLHGRTDGIVPMDQGVDTASRRAALGTG
jgi:hypothetical protein